MTYAIQMSLANPTLTLFVVVVFFSFFFFFSFGSSLIPFCLFFSVFFFFLYILYPCIRVPVCPYIRVLCVDVSVSRSIKVFYTIRPQKECFINLPKSKNHISDLTGLAARASCSPVVHFGLFILPFLLRFQFTFKSINHLASRKKIINKKKKSKYCTIFINEFIIIVLFRIWCGF